MPVTTTIKALICGVCFVFLATVASAGVSLNEGRFTITGRLVAVETREDAIFGPQDAWAFIAVREGSETYDIPVKCQSVYWCWSYAPNWFECHTMVLESQDPHDSAVTIRRRICSSGFALNACMKAQGTIQNHPDPVSHFGSLLVAETIGDVKPFNCDG